MLRRRFSAGVVTAIVAFASCREPTQITITVTTNAECPGEAAVEPTLIDTFITAGTKLQAEDLVAANVTSQCTPKAADNLVGTLVLIPSDGDDKTVDVVVIGGVDSHAPQTQGANALLRADDCRALVETRQGVLGQPCIVARRRLGFVDHTRLSLPILLDKRCIGVDCSEDKTCFGGVCVDPTVDCDEQGNCSDPSGEGGGGTGCDPAGCTADCEQNAQVGTCLDQVCDCGGCSEVGCDAVCATDGDVGSCSGEDCDCQIACDQATCATMTCQPPTTGMCNAQSNMCECSCDPGLCDSACGGPGTGSCDSGGCLCNQTCTMADMCMGVTCNDPFDVDCIGGSCGCSCNEGECDSGFPGGGMCLGGQTCQCWPCDHAECEADCLPGAGVCTPNGCDCSCVETSCTCPAQWQDPFCNAGDVCDCQCEETLCDNFCAMSGQVGTCAGTCQCSGGTSSSSTAISSTSATTCVSSSAMSSTSSGACDIGMCFASCMGTIGMTCDQVECGCDCNQSQCNSQCGPLGGSCASIENGPCDCNVDPTGGGGFGAMPNVGGGFPQIGGFGMGASP